LTNQINNDCNRIKKMIAFRSKENETKMNTKILRCVFALVIVVSVLGISTTTALADPPTRYEYSYTMGYDYEDLCSFPIHQEATISSNETDFYDQSGALVRVHLLSTEQDSFSAGEKTLVGIPYKASIEILFDSSGAITHFYGTGNIEKIWLPDGSLFISAGRMDLTNHPGELFVISPDKGNPGNLAGFCAALAP
jgi:hypothetical protein